MDARADEWKQKVHAYSMKLAENQWDAEDLAQEALLKVIGALNKDPHRELSNAFVYTIVLNTWKDNWRKVRTQANAVHKLQMREADPEESLFARELLEVLAHRLPPRSVVIVLLMDVFDFTAKETANLLNATEAAIQVAAGRIRRQLKQLARAYMRKPWEPEGKRAASSNPDMRQNFDALVEAFRQRNVQGICRSYLELAGQGVEVRRIETREGKFYFSLRDPDGHLYTISI